jgi:hypothetical protein
LKHFCSPQAQLVHADESNVVLLLTPGCINCVLHWRSKACLESAVHHVSDVTTRHAFQSRQQMQFREREMATTACSRGATGRGLLAAERKGWGSPATRGGRAPARVEAQEQAEGEHAGEEDQPELLIDNLDPVSTVLTVRFGNKLGTLSDTVQALSDLGLNISRAQVEISEGHRFYITDASTGAKILDSTRLEEIRMTVLQTMMLYHPEARDALSESYLSLEEASKPRPQQPAFSEPKQRDVVKVSTSTLGEGTRTLVNVETSDRSAPLHPLLLFRSSSPQSRFLLPQTWPAQRHRQHP